MTKLIRGILWFRPHPMPKSFGHNRKGCPCGYEPEEGINAIMASAEGLKRMKTGRIDHETTANIGIIHGGVATNVVCDAVVIEAEARSICEKKLEDTVKAMVEAMEKGAASLGAKVKTRIQKSYRGFTLKEMSPSVHGHRRPFAALVSFLFLISSGGGSEQIY